MASMASKKRSFAVSCMHCRLILQNKIVVYEEIDVAQFRARDMAIDFTSHQGMNTSLILAGLSQYCNIGEPSKEEFVNYKLPYWHP